jgi:adenine-specific DNA-methyltransferase
MREKIAYESPSPNEGRIEELKKLFPEAFSEGKLDVEKLVTLVGQSKVAGPERFNFTWNGKREALELLQTPSRATLLPCPEESVNFDTTKNLFIEGDNLEVLKLLLKPYFGKVKLIYIDPPYNTGQDFVYPDNYADPLATYLQLTGQSDSEGKLLTSNPETSGRYHSAWLSMMYPRLFLAKQLLRDDGLICISIDDHEYHSLKMMMDEIFGDDNFMASVIWKRRQVSDNRNLNNISVDHEYIIVYSTGAGSFVGTPKDLTKYKNPDDDPRGPWMSDNLTGLANASQRPNLHYDLLNPKTGLSYPPLSSRGWAYEPKSMSRLIEENRILWPAQPDGRPRLKRFLADIKSDNTGYSTLQDLGYTTDGTRTIEELFGEKLIQFPKPVSLCRNLICQATQSTGFELVLDFFAGSCTAAHAILEQNRDDGGNRRFIVVQLPEPTDNKLFPTIAEIGKERIRRVIEKLKKASDETPILKDKVSTEDLGFKVFKLTKPSIIPPSDTDDKETYFKLLAQHNEPLVKDWKPDEVLWEVALREGFGLLSTFQEKTLSNGNTIHELTDPEKDPPGRCVICLDAKVKADISQAFELSKDTLFICRDAALDDSAAANLALQCRLKTI